MDLPIVQEEKNIIFHGRGVPYDDELGNFWFIIIPNDKKDLEIFKTSTYIPRSVESGCIESDLLEMASTFVGSSSLYIIGGRVPNDLELSDNIWWLDIQNGSKRWEIGKLPSPCADPVIGASDDYLYILPGVWKYGYYNMNEDKYHSDRKGCIWNTDNNRHETEILPPIVEGGKRQWRRIRACAALDERRLLIAMDGEENNFFFYNPKENDWESCNFEDPLPKFIGETSFAASNGRLYILEVRGKSPAFLYIYDIKEGKLVMDKRPIQEFDDELWSMDESDRVVRIVPVADDKLCFLWLGPVSYENENMWPPVRMLHYLKVKFSINPNPEVKVEDYKSFSANITDLLCCLPCGESFPEEVKNDDPLYCSLASGADQDQEEDIVSLREEGKSVPYAHQLPETSTTQTFEIELESPLEVFDRHGEGSLPPGVPSEFRTRPVNARDVGHGDEILVRVDHTDSLSKGISGGVLQAGSQISIELRKTGQEYRIRLRGIDAPEMDQEYGNEAREELVKLVDGKPLTVQVYYLDRYERLVADVYCCDGKFLQKEMLKKGFAWHYKYFDDRQDLAACEEEARRRRVGLWASRNPEAPWEWNKRKRGIYAPTP